MKEEREDVRGDTCVAERVELAGMHGASTLSLLTSPLSSHSSI